jgi:hypothetical protein
MAKYQRKYSGRGIVSDFRRLLKTGDVSKLTPRLYHCLTLSGGFIAHYDLNGFRATFDGRLGELLAGEFYPLDNPERWAPERMQHLEDSVYRDGMTAGDIMRAIAEIGAELAPMVRARETAKRRMAEIAALRSRYGVTLEVASALVNGSRVKVVA